MPTRPALFPQHPPHARPQAESAPDALFLIVRVDPRHAFLARRHLRLAAAPAPRVRQLADPHGHGQACFLVQLRRGDVDALMDRLMRHLPAAEFGRLAACPAGVAP